MSSLNTLRGIAAAVVFLVASSLFAQPQMESIEVRVTSIDVVVTGNDGRPVHGLPQDAFRIAEDGKPQPITNFSEYGAVASELSANGSAAVLPALRQKRFVTFLIDNYSIDPIERKRVYDSLARAVTNECGAGDEAMFASWDRGGMHVLQPFTTDLPRVVAAIAAEKSRGGGMLYRSEEQGTKAQLLRSAIVPMKAGGHVDYASTETILRTWSAGRLALLTSLVRDTSLLVQSMAGLPGRKVIVFSTEYLPRVPGGEMYDWAQQHVAGFVSSFSDEYNNSISLEFEKLTRAANGSGVSIYPLYANVFAGARANDALDDGRGEQEAAARMATTMDSLQMLAGETGGSVLSNASDYDKALRIVDSDLANYYSLGYRSQGAATNRKVKVTIAGHPEYRVRARNSFAIRTADEQMADRVVSNLFHVTKGDMTIAVVAGAPVKQARDRFMIPLQVQIPSALVLLPDDKGMAGSYSVFLAVADPHGGLSPVAKQGQPIHMKADMAASMKGRLLVHQLQVVVRGGENTLSVGFRDDIGGTTGFARVKVDTNVKTGDATEIPATH
jgi:VWFA-related protein